MARKGKNSKSVLSRVRVTKHRKILRRVSQQGHCKAKETGKERMLKRKLVAHENTILRNAFSKYVRAKYVR